ncbi:MAG: thiamine pyrophosphate-binding protein, partial [Pirellulales bacterium]
MAKTTVSDLLIDRLIEWGVSMIFGYPGDGNNGIMEALRTRQEKIRFIQVRHEEGAAFMACAYARFTGKLGVCLSTSGPGRSICSTGCTTPSSTCSRCWPSPARPITT